MRLNGTPGACRRTTGLHCGRRQQGRQGGQAPTGIVLGSRYSAEMIAPFVGRAAELATIGALVGRANREGAPAVGLVTGQPGSGKSRLLQEYLAATDHGRTVSVAGFEPTEPIPLAAVGELVRRLATVPDHGPRLEALVFGSTAEAGHGVLAVFEAANRALASFGPLVLVVDDLQWVDQQSLALIHYLITASESSGQRFAVITASRPSPTAVTFNAGMAALLPDTRRMSIDLQGLAIDDGVTLVRAIDATLDDADAAMLWHRANGSPFWLEALALGRGSADTTDLVADRLRALSADAADLLNALAVTARPMPIAELADVLEWRAERLGYAVRELVARGVAAEAAGWVRLAHDLIREAAAAGIPEETLRRLHSRLATLIESSATNDLHRLAEALDHRAAAGLPLAKLALRLTASPKRRLIDGETLRQLASISDGAAPGSSEQVDLDVAIGKLAGEVGDAELAVRHWSRAALASTDATVRLRGELEAARAAYVVGRATTVRAHLGRARSLPVDPVTAIELDTVEAELGLWVEHDTTAGAIAAARAVAGGDALASSAGGPERLPVGTRRAVLAALLAAVDAALQQERAHDVLELAEQALSVAGGLGGEARLDALLRTAFAYRTLGHWRVSSASYREAWELSQRLILPIPMIDAGLGFARVLLGLGQLEEAQAVARDVNALEARIRPWRRWDTSEATVQEIAVSLGEPGALARFRDQASQVDPHFAIKIHQFVATWLARKDGASQAGDIERALVAARASSELAGCPRCGRELLVVSAEVLARIDRLDDARSELAAWEARYEGPDYAALALWRGRAQAAIAMGGGAPEAASILADLAAAFDDAGKLEDAIWTRLDLGRVLRASGQRSESIAVLTRAASDADTAGALGVGRIARKALRELGVRAWKRGSAPTADALSSLTGRELEVARLVADGASNREVADALSLSPKTVERHLTNILAKLGARNRTELASRIHAGVVRESPDE